MTKWIGAAIMALTLTVGGAAVIDPAMAASLQVTGPKPEMRKATSPGTRRHARHSLHYAYRPYEQPRYIDRPYYYAPAPNLALAFGFGFGPGW